MTPRFKFLGWQHMHRAKGEIFFPLFNVLDPSSPRFGSTLSLRTLIDEGFFVRFKPRVFRANKN